MQSSRTMRQAAAAPKADDARRPAHSHSHSAPPPPSAAASSSSLAHTLAGAFTRVGFDDEWNPAAATAAIGSGAVGSSTVPRAELVRELEWLEGALGSLADPARRHFLAVFARLQPAQVLTPHQIQAYERLELSDRVLHDPAELEAARRAMGGAAADDAADDDDDDEDLEALEREIAALSTQNTRLDQRLSSLDLSRRQIDTRRLQLSAQKSALESQWDAEAERDSAFAAQKPGAALVHSNRIHSTHEIAAAVSAANSEYNQALSSIEDAAQQIETLITKGRYTAASNNVQARPTNNDQQQQSARSSVYSELPSMSSDGLSAFEADTLAERPAQSNGSPSLPSSNHAAAGASTASSVDSPFILHHPSLLSAYLAKDDAWARSLNTLFRAQFGSPASSAATNEPVSRLQQTVAMLQQDSEGSALTEMDAVISATPHGKHLPRTPLTLRARARASMAPKTNLRPVHEHDEEEKQQHNGNGLQKQISFTTPPHASRTSSAASSAASAPVSSSSLSPALHAQYTSELRRLYDSFPDSQNFWLLANLDYLGQKARVATQHSSMVSEQTTRALGRRGINEAIAEAAVQVAAATESLSLMLTTPPSSSGALDPKVQSFPALWSSLRSLQLLEVLRVDLEYKFRRQSEYLAAQRGIISALLEQRARHELILGAQRWGLDRLEATRDVLHAAWVDLAAEARRLDARVGAYHHLQSLHAGSQAMTAPSRLGIDARARIVARAARMADIGARTVRNMQAPSAPPPPTQNPTTAAAAATNSSSASAAPSMSFESLLSSAQYLSCYPAALAARMSSQSASRSAHLAALSRASASARAVAFDDAQDVVVGEAERNSRRLNHTKFARALERTDRAVDQAAAGLNAALQSHAQLVSKLHAPSSFIGAAGDASQVDRAVRPVWTEFIQAPDLLDQRIRRMQQQLKEAESR